MKKFAVKFKNTKLIGDLISNNDQADLLILHGGGGSSRARYVELRQALFKNGISSCMFDFIGHGETGGSLEGSSLEERTEQALVVIKELDLSPSALMGSSMGAHTAIKLLQHMTPKNLILQVPAVYIESAYTLPFGQDFSGEIRQDGSWKKTDAFEILAKFAGNLLIIAAEHDDVIPRELIEMLFDRASSAAHKELYEIQGAPHSMNKYLAENPALLNQLFEKISAFLKRRLILDPRG